MYRWSPMVPLGRPIGTTANHVGHVVWVPNFLLGFCLSPWARPTNCSLFSTPPARELLSLARSEVADPHRRRSPASVSVPPPPPPRERGAECCSASSSSPIPGNSPPRHPRIPPRIDSSPLSPDLSWPDFVTEHIFFGMAGRWWWRSRWRRTAWTAASAAGSGTTCSPTPPATLPRLMFGSSSGLLLSDFRALICCDAVLL